MPSKSKSSNANGSSAVISPTPTAAPYQMRVSVLFLIASILFVAGVGFSVGIYCRQILQPDQQHAATVGNASQEDDLTETLLATLPPPQSCKTLPNFVYSSKHFEYGTESTSDNLLIRRAGEGVCDDEDLKDDDEEESPHAPAGQHLLIDLQNVQAFFLNSRTQLAGALVQLIHESGLTLLSYHCHGLQPTGISCVGVLLESHLSLHTWPSEGVILLDVFTCGENELLPLLPKVKELFGPPAIKTEDVLMKWAFKPRGFPRADEKETRNVDETTDMNQFTTGWMEFDQKDLVDTVDTPFQTIQVFDLWYPYKRSRTDYLASLDSKKKSYQSQHPTLFLPDRLVYLDSILQSRRTGDAAYHEALVHPALLTHTGPARRVVIVGGGEGATLREVLKYKDVTEVIMLEIDEIMVNTSRKLLPDWSDCSYFTSTSDCFDDPRARVEYVDAVGWFLDRFGRDASVKEEKVDVIIMDALYVELVYRCVLGHPSVSRSLSISSQ